MPTSSQLEMPSPTRVVFSSTGCHSGISPDRVVIQQPRASGLNDGQRPAKIPPESSKCMGISYITFGVLPPAGVVVLAGIWGILISFGFLVLLVPLFVQGIWAVATGILIFKAAGRCRVCSCVLSVITGLAACGSSLYYLTFALGFGSFLWAMFAATFSVASVACISYILSCVTCYKKSTQRNFRARHRYHGRMTRVSNRATRPRGGQSNRATRPRGGQSNRAANSRGAQSNRATRPRGGQSNRATRPRGEIIGVHLRDAPPDYVSVLSNRPSDPPPDYVSASDRPFDPPPDYVSVSDRPSDPPPDYVSVLSNRPFDPPPDYVSVSVSPSDPPPDYVSVSDHPSNPLDCVSVSDRPSDPPQDCDSVSDRPSDQPLDCVSVSDRPSDPPQDCDSVSDRPSDQPLDCVSVSSRPSDPPDCVSVSDRPSDPPRGYVTVVTLR